MSPITSTVEAFLAHKRALGRNYHSEAAELTLLVRFAEQNGLSDLEHPPTGRTRIMLRLAGR